ncbi:nuclear transport factor 2 family protein [Pseudanabaena yagii]|uniref:Nuclear transport factor 2 family protein n=1 Tax=Pseudanabaena yagii GIHE-NHR1 TaxID=2722753 RepID=A0ABX1LSW6_9CYAN|nr:nuclear transport factor 2 family protein [Pseudanabaena yagii]NMF59252.1 nuclear transport factor 2 family protein [Pseudanabaena yagii GIHE-NHR1]
MILESQALAFAEDWIRTWNSHDLDAILSHYSEDIVLISPIATRILNEPSGKVSGKTALRAYFQKGLAFYPELKFELIDIIWGISSIVLYYINQNGVKAAEFMEIDAEGKVVNVIANYN